VEEIELRREAIRLKKLEIASNPEKAQEISSTEKPQEEDEEVMEEQKHEFLAFARVFSGRLIKGKTLFILSPKHNTEDFIGKNIDINSSTTEINEISKHCTKFIANDIYLMMGRDLEPIDSVPCGNIVAIGGLENLVLKSATLSTTIFCPSFTSMYMQTSPIVRVAIEPKNPSKMKELIKGLKVSKSSKFNSKHK
jgi:ribosome assembly protein 1